MGFFGWVKSSYNSVKHAVNSGISKVSKVGSKVLHTAGQSIHTVYNDAKSAIAYIPKQGVALANKIVDRTADTVSGLGKDLAMPLAIGAGILGAIFLLKN